MPIDHDRKLLFIHIPKTGGTSLTSVLFPRQGETQHFPASDLPKEQWENYFTFAFVRNPYERILSSYTYHVKSGYRGVFARKFPRLKSMSFQEYLETFVVPMTSPNFYSQVRYVTHDQSEKKIDFVGRFERLHEDYARLLERIGVSAELGHQLKSSHDHYSRYFDPRTRAIVEDAYADDLETFGYSFEEAQAVSVSEADRSGEPVFLNVGSGDWRRPGWLNLDAASEHYRKAQEGKVDIEHDLMSKAPLPLKDDSLEGAYSSHAIEHISDEAAAALFGELCRCIKPGGVFRVTCPDMDFIYDAFVRGDEYFFSRFAFRKAFPNISLAQAFLHCFAAVRTTHVDFELCSSLEDEDVYRLFLRHDRQTAFDLIVKAIPAGRANARYPQTHLNWWTADKLEGMLRAAGFGQVVRQRYNSSLSREMTDRRQFDTTRPWMSLYVEAVK